MTGRECVPLGDAMVRRGGTVDPSKYPDELFDLYSIPAYDQRSPDQVLGAEIGSSKQIVQPGDVLLSRIVPHIRRAWIVGANDGRRLIASGEWIVFRSDKFDPSWLRHLLLSDRFHREFMATVAGVGGSLLRARPAQVAQIGVELPPLDEQRRIAAILNQAEQVRLHGESATALLGELATSLFLDMFGSPIGNPKGWDLFPLGELGNVTTGKTPPTIDVGAFGGPVPFITPGDLETIGPSARSLSAGGAASSRTVREGATLVCCIGATIGKVGMATETSAFNQQINAVEWNSRILDEVGFQLMRLMKPQVAMLGSSTTMPLLPKSKFEKLLIPMPPKALQEEYRTSVTKLAQVVERNRIASVAAGELFCSVQSRAFAGQL